MPLTSPELDEWADAYIQAHLTPDHPKEGLTYKHPLWWAVDRFFMISSPAEAEDAWQVILTIVSRTDAEQVLGVLAAGPLEDLIGGWGSQLIERIESEASRNPQFRDVLRGVWEGGDPIGKRVTAAKSLDRQA